MIIKIAVVASAASTHVPRAEVLAFHALLCFNPGPDKLPVALWRRINHAQRAAHLTAYEPPTLICPLTGDQSNRNVPTAFLFISSPYYPCVIPSHFHLFFITRCFLLRAYAVFDSLNSSI